MQTVFKVQIMYRNDVIRGFQSFFGTARLHSCQVPSDIELRPYTQYKLSGDENAKSVHRSSRTFSNQSLSPLLYEHSI
ncbi:hypothetical protein Naga_100033g2 [Nannochloropsis gaditana]|uniref:Uncharacterized protein n=1 Tax=Nannochloropsis gaditana TaxID=72520 RepID=W7U459_9STRA|nr:hypothetical protein Naga_100033g2 [Nannochloropsis gaditana]